MSDFTFFFNPMSRAQIARWAFHEVGLAYHPVRVEWDAKPPELLAANPLGKLPTIIHHAPDGDHAVHECAAICHYLAEVSGSHLLPQAGERANYWRWLFVAAGPVEAAVTNKAFGWEPQDARQQISAGFGSFDRVMDLLDGWLGAHDFACGGRFTMADVYLGSQVDWGLQFGTMPARASFTAYQARLRDRAAYQEAKAIDTALMAGG